MRRFVTSEAVTEGHPDKVCDLIADSILDEAIKQDQYSHVAIEASIKNDLIFLFGEITSTAILDYEQIALETIKEVGYKEDYKIIMMIDNQSNEIAQAVNHENVINAGDQGIMFGYACNETSNYMPTAIEYAHRLAKQLNLVYKTNNGLRPDGKTQVTVEYRNNKVYRIDSIIISCQHAASLDSASLNKLIKNEVIGKVIEDSLLDDKTKIIINPSGSFIKGGSFGDSGTTGRKIVCDSYGGDCKVGGGCYSSKDPSKVDRSAAYYCRYVAKNIVANKLADKCEVSVSYAIGLPDPTSLCIDTFGTEKIELDLIYKLVKANFDFSVSNIIKELDLLKPIYKQTTNYGHFGKDEMSWEQIKSLAINQ